LDVQYIQEIQQEIDALGPWFHNLHLPGNIQTAPHHQLGDFPTMKWRTFAPSLPERLDGWRALDIGCNAGFYSFELARRGAQVTAIDIDAHYLAQARWAASIYGLDGRVEFRQMQVYDLAHIGETFDLVLFMGVFYHLRYPTLALDIVVQKVKRLMVFQTLTIPGHEVYDRTDGLDINNRDALREVGWPKMAFIEHRFAGDPTNWWVPNHAGVEAILRASGMRVIDRPGHEIYICEPDPEHPSTVMTWNAGELLSATGRRKRHD
jgi:tRNA (mo5U34)-methyltransferase